MMSEEEGKEIDISDDRHKGEPEAAGDTSDAVGILGQSNKSNEEKATEDTGEGKSKGSGDTVDLVGKSEAESKSANQEISKDAGKDASGKPDEDSDEDRDRPKLKPGRNTGYTVVINPYTGIVERYNKEEAKRRRDEEKRLRDLKRTFTFPTTLEEFGFRFTEEGKLRNIETGEPFIYQVREVDSEYNQKRYEALGEIITEHVYELLVSEAKMTKWQIPILSRDKTEPRGVIFATKDAFDVRTKLLCLIPGDGVVKSGQWSRKLIINESLDHGSMLPYIHDAVAAGFAVMIMNPNDNHRMVDGEKVPIRGSKTSYEHAEYIYDTVIERTLAKRIAIIAHSHGGVLTLEMAKAHQKDFMDRVFAVGFTDSVHSLAAQEVPRKLRNHFIKVSRNWVSSSEPRDTVIPSRISNEIERVSAGHKLHEYTSWSAKDSVFKFIKERYRDTVLDNF